MCPKIGRKPCRDTKCYHYSQHINDETLGHFCKQCWCSEVMGEVECLEIEEEGEK